MNNSLIIATVYAAILAANQVGKGERQTPRRNTCCGFVQLRNGSSPILPEILTARAISINGMPIAMKE
ncbi:hypothetical protein Psta_4578 [Pirellula staleyi DSM 6068]|uniref:Uncharacterized protein n=1 Tax=Pirellula staleyi (strain ATCC 27377 / DSM 6068 / ICPB 4128) TaxID=530564 RepID=D2R717_PIRSD|nr:hypothetical protein Psta_4578 [Pirellula staleyi DSM 6068]